MSIPTLQFIELRDTGKTKTWRVECACAGLGRITWYPPWRRYVLEPAGAMVWDRNWWDRNCLMQVVAFIDEKMAERETV